MSAVVRHDAGGKRKLTLQPGIIGDALFHGPGDCYRTILSRRRDDTSTLEPYALFCGMNPSTAEKDVDDPTIRKELAVTWASGFHHYVKVNVGDYRATNPADLSRPGVLACSPQNHASILELAAHASVVVLAWGRLPAPLRGHGAVLLNRLRRQSANRMLDARVTWKPLMCLGQNQDGSPKHPLYLANGTALRPFDFRLLDQ